MRSYEAADLYEEPEPAPARVPGDPPPSLGLSRMRLAVLVAGFLCLYLVGMFARQVGEAAAAGSQADQMRARNAEMQAEIDSLQAELQLIQQQSFIGSTARGYGLGSAGEVTVTLDSKAPPLPSDAPGSASIVRAPAPVTQSPLEAWLSALFGSG